MLAVLRFGWCDDAYLCSCTAKELWQVCWKQHCSIRYVSYSTERSTFDQKLGKGMVIYCFSLTIIIVDNFVGQIFMVSLLNHINSLVFVHYFQNHENQQKY